MYVVSLRLAIDLSMKIAQDAERKASVTFNAPVDLIKILAGASVVIGKAVE